MLGVIMKTQIQGEAYYNAYEKDIAVVNIFFGGSTVFGEETSYVSSNAVLDIIYNFLSDPGIPGVRSMGPSVYK